MRSKKTLAACLSLAASMAACGIAAPAAAQSAEISPGEDASGTGDIVVTARKREESLQETPLAVTAFGSQGIQTRDIRGLSDLATFTPGFNFSAYVGRRTDRPVIRGQSSILANVTPGIESGAAYFIDGIYWSGSLQSLNFETIERVEVIKGPQSALYGRNSYSGAINFVTQSPTKEISGKIQGRLASHREREVTGFISGPIVQDILGFTVEGRYYNYDGEYRNQVTGRHVASEETKSGSAVLEFTPSPDFKLRLRGSYAHDRDGHPAIYLWGSDQFNCFPSLRSNFYRQDLIRSTPGNIVFGTNQNGFYCGAIPAREKGVEVSTGQLSLLGTDRDQYFAGGNASWDIGGSGYTLVAQGGYRRDDDYFGGDVDYSGPLRLASQNERNLTNDTNGEIRLSSPPGERFSWAIGGFAFDQKIRVTNLTPANPTGAGVIPRQRFATKNKSVFGMANFDATEQLKFTLEGRYAVEKRRLIEATGFVGRATFKSFAPRFTIAFQATPDVNLYAIAAKGIKPGGLNGSTGAAINALSFDEETSTNYEAGIKSQWLDGALTLNLAGYYTKARGVQLTTAVVANNGGRSSVVTNQGRDRIYGFEVEATARLSSAFTTTLTYAYTNPEFTSGCDETLYIINSGGFRFPPNATAQDLAACSLKGKKLPLVAAHNVSLFAQYRTPLSGSWEAFATGTATYTSKQYAQSDNYAYVGDATIVGFQIGAENEIYRVTFFGRNIFDENSPVLASRLFDWRYGGATRYPAGVTGTIDTRMPQGFFGSLRRGPSFGAEMAVRF